MGCRRPNPRLVKVHRNYSVEEIARLFRLHKNTVRNWLRQGLTLVDERRPLLILGRELSRFLQERRQNAKQVCGPGRLFCVACRAPKVGESAAPSVNCDSNKKADANVNV